MNGIDFIMAERDTQIAVENRVPLFLIPLKMKEIRDVSSGMCLPDKRFLFGLLEHPGAGHEKSN
jgi:hypothetical protein